MPSFLFISCQVFCFSVKFSVSFMWRCQFLYQNFSFYYVVFCLVMSSFLFFFYDKFSVFHIYFFPGFMSSSLSVISFSVNFMPSFLPVMSFSVYFLFSYVIFPFSPSPLGVTAYQIRGLLVGAARGTRCYIMPYCSQGCYRIMMALTFRLCLCCWWDLCFASHSVCIWPEIRFFLCSTDSALRRDAASLGIRM